MYFRSGLLKYRREFYPPTPHALVDVQVMPGTWGSTSEGEIFHRETNVRDFNLEFKGGGTIVYGKVKRVWPDDTIEILAPINNFGRMLTMCIF